MDGGAAVSEGVCQNQKGLRWNRAGGRTHTAAEPQDAKAEEGCGSSRAGRGGGRKRQGCVCVVGWACVCVLCGVCVAIPGEERSKQTKHARGRCKQACGAGKVLERPRTREMTGHRHDLTSRALPRAFCVRM